MLDSNDKDILYMKLALDLAKRARELDEVPVGSIVIIDDQIVGEGYNQSIKGSDPTAHAEMVALRAAANILGNYRLPEATLYVTLEPCVMCVGAILHARIKRLVFGASDPKTGAVVSVFKVLDEKSLNHKIEFAGGVLAEECGDILRCFFKDKR